MNGPRSYGEEAVAYASELEDLPVFVIAADPTAAWSEMLEERRAGANTAALVLLDDPRALTAFKAADAICSQVTSYDERRFHMEDIERGTLDMHGRSILEYSVYDSEFAQNVRKVLYLVGTLVVRSFTELARVRNACGLVGCNVVTWVPARSVPALPSPRTQELIVIWAADYPSQMTALAEFALAQLPSEVVVIARGGGTAYSRLAHVEPDSPEVPGILSRAACVVDLTLSDPGWAHALTDAGLPVAAAVTSGADELVDGLATYDPSSFRSIANAVADTLGRGAGRVRGPAPGLAGVRESLALADARPPALEPLVSIVVPTFNRRAMLEATLRDLVRQTYRNIEIVVVNDGGEPVADLAFDPRIQVLDRDVNVGVAGAINAGFEASAGDYLLHIPDDDRYYPDHVMRLVEACERTGSSVGHTNTLLAMQVAEDGLLSTYYDPERFSTTLDPSESYVLHRICAYIMRRAVFDEIGGYESLHLLDLEFQIRLAQRYDVVHVPLVTAEWIARAGEQMSTAPAIDRPEALLELFRRHPATGRPYVAALREKFLKRFGAPERE